MERLIRYTKLNFKPSKQFGTSIDINKMVDEAQEWMLDNIDHYTFPCGTINLDMFRKEMYDWFLTNLYM